MVVVVVLALRPRAVLVAAQALALALAWVVPILQAVLADVLAALAGAVAAGEPLWRVGAQVVADAVVVPLTL